LRCRKIQCIVEGKPFNLIESLADRIAAEILESDTRIECTRVAVRKPHVAVSGILDSLGIEILRTRDS
jgi:dihydroneopterin aldolase